MDSTTPHTTPPSEASLNPSPSPNPSTIPHTSPTATPTPTPSGVATSSTTGSQSEPGPRRLTWVFIIVAITITCGGIVTVFVVHKRRVDKTTIPLRPTQPQNHVVGMYTNPIFQVDREHTASRPDNTNYETPVGLNPDYTVDGVTLDGRSYVAPRRSDSQLAVYAQPPAAAPAVRSAPNDESYIQVSPHAVPPRRVVSQLPVYAHPHPLASTTRPPGSESYRKFLDPTESST